MSLFVYSLSYGIVLGIVKWVYYVVVWIIVDVWLNFFVVILRVLVIWICWGDDFWVFYYEY